MHRSISQKRNQLAAWIAFGLSVGSTIGCQQWQMRPDNNELLAAQRDDDWDRPITTSQVPRPDGARASTGRISSRGETARVEQPKYQPPQGPVRASLNDRSDDAGQRKSTSTVVAVGPQSNDPPKEPTQDIVDTHVDDVDFESALESLPPTYRDALKQTLIAVQSRAANNPTNTPSQVTQSTADSLDTKPGNVPATTAPTIVSLHSDEPSPPNSGRSSSTDSSLVTEDSKNQKSTISFRISDGKVLSESLGSPTSHSNEVSASVASPAPSSTTASSPVQPAVISSVATANPPAGVTTASATDSKTAEHVSTAAATVPATSSTSNHNSWHQITSQAVDQLERQLRESPPTDDRLRISQEVSLRMLYVAQRRLDDALRPIDRLSTKEQDYVRHQMQALYEASNPDASPARSRHWTLVMNSQREATNQLAAVSNLEVRSSSFCTEVDGYGMIKRFARNQFTPDQDVLLYCEVDNVEAERVKAGYETQLQGSYEIWDSRGQRVAEQLLPMEPEVCQNHRRDYFIVYRIYMPQQIAPGSYQLRLTVEDMKARKFGQSSIDFEIRK
jgi:hypothetical protein